MFNVIVSSSQQYQQKKGSPPTVMKSRCQCQVFERTKPRETDKEKSPKKDGSKDKKPK